MFESYKYKKIPFNHQRFYSTKQPKQEKIRNGIASAMPFPFPTFKGVALFNSLVSVYPGYFFFLLKVAPATASRRIAAAATGRLSPVLGELFAAMAAPSP